MQNAHVLVVAASAASSAPHDDERARQQRAGAVALRENAAGPVGGDSSDHGGQ